MNPGEPSRERFSSCSTSRTARRSRRQTFLRFCVIADGVVRVAVIRRSTSRAARCLRSFIVLSNVRGKNAAQSRAVAGGGVWALDKMVHFV